MKTNHKYINEYLLSDEVMEACQECENSIIWDMYEYNNKIRQIKLNSFFESSSDESALVEKEKKNILYKIGEAISKIINKLADFIKKIFNTITGRTRDIQSDAQKVDQLIAMHPELRDQIYKGLKEEWFTYKDILQYENDTFALMDMLEKNIIDHRTFTDKMQAAADKFEKSAKPVIKIVGTIGGVAIVGGQICKGCSQIKETIDNLLDRCKKTKKKITSGNNVDPSVAQASVNALNQCVQKSTKEADNRVKGANNASNYLKNQANKHKK